MGVPPSRDEETGAGGREDTGEATGLREPPPTLAGLATRAVEATLAAAGLATRAGDATAVRATSATRATAGRVALPGR
jgi:hypothetical protein